MDSNNPIPDWVLDDSRCDGSPKNCIDAAISACIRTLRWSERRHDHANYDLAWRALMELEQINGGREPVFFRAPPSTRPPIPSGARG